MTRRESSQKGPLRQASRGGRRFLGSDWQTALNAIERARDAGLTELRAQVVGQISSFTDGWVFRRRLAELLDCSVRTVQRAITQAKAEGLLGVARAKRSDIPPGAREPLPCGWSHRWTIARDLVGAAAAAAIRAARLEQLTRAATRAAAGTARAIRRREPPTDAQLEQRRQQQRSELAAWSDAHARDGPA